MDGVAYTTGSHTAKEIHFACQHIVNCADRCADEIRGVLVHEVVHCYQYNGEGVCPGGLVEGIAGAYIRLHWTFGFLSRTSASQIGFASVPVSRLRTGILAGIGGTRAIMSQPTFCNG
jgi:uncharacterized membrane protein